MAPAAALALAALAALTPSPATATTAQQRLSVLALRGTPDHAITFIADPSGPAAPAAEPTATVTAAGESLPAQVAPLWSDSADVGLVLDASTDGAAALAGGGLSGAAGFLLQLPPEARSGVITAREPPEVAAPPAVGASDDVAALSTVRAGGAPALSDALTLAVRQLPGEPRSPSVIALYTSATDAGGEAAGELGDRLRRANAVLAVVTSAPDPGYWTEVARATGGVAVATAPDRAIRAFDEAAEVLRGRYVVSFPRPPEGVGEASVRWTGSGAPAVVSLAVPPETRAPAGGTARPPAGALAGAALLALVLLAAAGVLVARRRRPVRAGPGLEQEDLVPAVPEGVRVFDMNPADPREITGSLFEPRSVRDARLRQAREPQSHGQEADAQAAGEPPARGPERTGDDD